MNNLVKIDYDYWLGMITNMIACLFEAVLPLDAFMCYIYM